MDSVIKMVLDDNWTDLTKHVEQKAATKIKEKINEKKVALLAKLNANYDSQE
jgi:hypothetical protein